MNNLQRRAARIAGEAKSDKPRLVSGTEPRKLVEVRPIGNSKRNRDTAKSIIESLRESFNE